MHVDNHMTIRVLFSLNDEVFERFRSLVPSRQRSKLIETFMRGEIARIEREKEARVERLAMHVETHPDYAAVREVTSDVDRVAGEMVA